MSYDEVQLPNPMEPPSVDQGANSSVMPNSELNNSSNLGNAQPIQIPQTKALGVQQSLGVNDQTQQAVPQQSQQGISTSSPAIADDADLIEKEWVEKAKEIVDKTRDNPYLQNKAISEMKADYIKKRYNKDVTKSEE